MSTNEYVMISKADLRLLVQAAAVLAVKGPHQPSGALLAAISRAEPLGRSELGK